MLKDNQINIYSLFMIMNIIFAFSYEIPDIKVIFLTVIVVVLISLQRILKDDYENGIIEQIILYQNIYITMYKLIISHWLKNGLVLSLLSTLLISIHEITCMQLLIHTFSLIYTTLIITFIGTIGESATINEKTNIKSIIISLPLLIPALVLNTLITHSLIDIKLFITFILITLTLAIISTIISAINIKLAIKFG